MKIAVIGGGPAGLYFAVLAKKANPEHDIHLVERNPPDATFGWGVVFSEETLGSLRDADYETYTAIEDSFARWNAIDIHYRGSTVRSRGHVFSGISRKALLNILQRRCAELGVDLAFQTEARELSELAGYDLVVGADGINGVARNAHADVFKPTLDLHRTKYIWFGTDRVLDAFTFIFRQNRHGLFQVHAYPFDANTSTFIVECSEAAWRRAGLDAATEADSIAYCEELFAEELQGRHLLSNRSLWVSFITLRHETWSHGNLVLLGDAAHTAHFTIGSGTKLAMEDAVALVDALRRRHPLRAALAEYETERQAVIERFQDAARESARYFENVTRYAGFEPIQFAFNLLTRSRRITYASLGLRDPDFVRSVDAWFARAGSGGRQGELQIAPPPMFTPLTLRSLRLTNRVVSAPLDRPGLEAVAAGGAGLVLTEMTAVSAEGRITPASPGIYEADQVQAWRRTAEAVHERGARLALLLGHAGRRGSTRPKTEGVDRPLRQGGWPLIAASPIPYTSRGCAPRPMHRGDMDRVRADFVHAATAAAGSGFEVLELQFGQGYLLAGFLSPLTNARTDAYGGSLENRMRFPLEVFVAVREAWPGVLAVRLTALDWVENGFTLDDAVAVAAVLRAHGCDLVHPVMGQTVAETHPDYGRMFGVPASDRIRNETGIPTLTSGHITTADEVNTILAAGRADLCVLEMERWRTPIPE